MDENVGTHFVNAVVKERQAGVFVADERAFLDEADEHLGLGHERVKLLVRAVAALQESCRFKTSNFKN